MDHFRRLLFYYWKEAIRKALSPKSGVLFLTSCFQKTPDMHIHGQARYLLMNPVIEKKSQGVNR